MKKELIFSMKNDDIISRILEKSTLDEIKAELDTELEKSEVDYDKVAQLTEAISKLTENSLDENQISENISKINQEYDITIRRNRISHIYKWVCSLSACLIIAMTLNCYTMSSFGENIFTAIVEMTKSGFVVDFSGNNSGGGTTVQTTTTSTDSTETSNTTTISANTTTISATNTTTAVSTFRPISSTPEQSDNGTSTMGSITFIGSHTTNTTVVSTTVSTALPPASTEEIIIGDIIDKNCKELGITPCFLEYKSNMQLEDFSYDKNELSTDCYFTFTNQNTKLNITIEQYNDKENIPPLLIPSNNSEYHTINSSLGEIYIFGNGTNSKAVFLHENAVYTLSVYNMSMKQLEDIVISYSPAEQK